MTFSTLRAASVSVLCLMLSIVTGTLQAKSANLIKVPEAKTYVVPAAQLMRVDDGVFELEIGKTIDLTDRKILLSMRCNDKGNCDITLNGERARWRAVGSRIDLKKERGTRDFVKDKSVCVLDVVDIALPKGADGVATFRIYCI